MKLNIQGAGIYSGCKPLTQVKLSSYAVKTIANDMGSVSV